MVELEQCADVAKYRGKFTCEWHCSADFFALIKLMRPEKDEILEDGSKADSCTCALCGEKRTTKENMLIRLITYKRQSVLQTTKLK